MKSCILFIITFLSTFMLNAQSPIATETHGCATQSPSPLEKQALEEALKSVAVSRNTGTSYIPIKFHVVRKGDATGGVSLEGLAIGIANLNYSFLSSGLEFFICGDINYIDNSDFYEYSTVAPDSDNESTYCDPEDVGNAVNIYVVESINIDGFNASGYAYFPANSLRSTRIFMTINAMSLAPHSTLTHEFGHHYNLYHTHEGTENGNSHANAERVVRTGSNANCTSKGDNLCDTEADPRYSSSTFDYSNCVYTGNEMDDLGVQYTPPVANIMSYYPDKCGGHFTQGQFDRMAAGYTIRTGHTAYNFSCSPTNVTAPTITSASFNSNSNSVDISWTDNASNELGFLIEKSTTSSTAGFKPVIYGGVGANIVNFSDSDLMPNTDYWYRIKAVNGGHNAYSNVVKAEIGFVYCVPDVHSSARCPNGQYDIYLDDFTIKDNSNAVICENINSGCSFTGGSNSKNYKNYKGSISKCTLEVGKVYSFQAYGSNYHGYSGIFIDGNADSDFNDPEELRYNNTDQFNNYRTGSFTLDSSFISGTSFLRIIVSNSTVIDDPCKTYSLNETEDYEIEIVNNIPQIHSTTGCISITEPVSGSNFVPFYHNGKIVAEINPQGQNLGNVTLQVNNTSTIPSTSLNEAFLPRNFNIESTSPPTSNVTIRFYMLDAELESYNVERGNNITPNQLLISWYSDSNGQDDCDFTNNSSNNGSIGKISTVTTKNYDVASTNGFIQEFDIDHFTEFASAPEALLPIKLQRFQASLVKSKIFMEWETQTEINASHYEIERSKNAEDWQNIGFVHVQSENNHSINTYHFVDSNPKDGNNYYRLKMVDIDDYFTYSSIKSVYVETDKPKISLFPNPTNEKLYFISNGNHSVKIQSIDIITLDGRHMKKAVIPGGEHSYEMNLSTINPGVYIAKILCTDGQIYIRKIIKN